MLGEFTRYTRHVLWGPREDVPVLTEELDERAFLFFVQARPHSDEPGLVVFVKVGLLRISCRLEVQFASRLDRLRYLQLLFAGLALELFHLLIADHGLSHLGAVRGAGDGAFVVSGDGDDSAWAR